MDNVINNPGAYSLYTKEQYDAYYTSGFNAGKAAGDVKHTITFGMYHRWSDGSYDYYRGYCDVDGTRVWEADNNIAIPQAGLAWAHSVTY